MRNWEKVYNITPCYFFSFSNEGLVTGANDVLLRHICYAPDEVIHVKKLTDLLTVGSKVFFDTHFYPMIRMQGSVNEIFLSFRTKDGRELPVLVNVVTEIHDGHSEMHCGGMQISNRNRFEKEILEAKKVAESALLANKELIEVKQQLQQHQELLEEQLANLSRINSEHKQINKVLSHDLQEPIRKISLFSKRITDDFSANLDLCSLNYLKRINASANKISRLINSMERFIGLDYRELKLEETNLSEIFTQAIDKAGCRRPDVAVTMQGTMRAMADQELMLLLFTELLANSLRFRKGDGSNLVIDLKCEDIRHNMFSEIDGKYRFKEFLRLTYSDNGVGFENYYADKLFNLFEKGGNGEVGLGLGLAQCQKIASLHRGSIKATGKLGEGATFILLLPAKGTHVDKST